MTVTQDSLSPSLALSSTTEEMRQKPVLVANVTGWTLVDGHDEYGIVISYFKKLADADAPTSSEEGEKSEPVVVSQSQQRFSSFLALHAEIGEDLGVEFTATKNIFAGLDVVKTERVTKLGAYLNAALLSAQFGERPSPGMPMALCTFVGIEEDKLKEVAGDSIKIAQTASPAAAEPATSAKPKGENIFTTLVRAVSSPMKPKSAGDANAKPQMPQIFGRTAPLLCVSPRKPSASRRVATIKELKTPDKTPPAGTTTPPAETATPSTIIPESENAAEVA